MEKQFSKYSLTRASQLYIVHVQHPEAPLLSICCSVSSCLQAATVVATHSARGRDRARAQAHVSTWSLTLTNASCCTQCLCRGMFQSLDCNALGKEWIFFNDGMREHAARNSNLKQSILSRKFNIPLKKIMSRRRRVFSWVRLFRRRDRSARSKVEARVEADAVHVLVQKCEQTSRETKEELAVQTPCSLLTVVQI